jgi:hypothetical protein
MEDNTKKITMVRRREVCWRPVRGGVNVWSADLGRDITGTTWLVFGSSRKLHVVGEVSQRFGAKVSYFNVQGEMIELDIGVNYASLESAQGACERHSQKIIVISEKSLIG